MVLLGFSGLGSLLLVLLPKGSKYHYGSYLVAIWSPKVHTIPVLGPFGLAVSPLAPLRLMQTLRASSLAWVHRLLTFSVNVGRTSKAQNLSQQG